MCTATRDGTLARVCRGSSHGISHRETVEVTVGAETRPTGHRRRHQPHCLCATPVETSIKRPSGTLGLPLSEHPERSRDSPRIGGDLGTHEPEFHAGESRDEGEVVNVADMADTKYFAGYF